MLNYILFQKIKIFLLDILFPIDCLFCQKSNEWLCSECLEKISILKEQVCPYCEKNISPFGKICSHCKSNFLIKNQSFWLDSLIVSTSYQKNKISKIIHYFKYNFVCDLSIPLAKIMIKAILEHNLPLPDIIIPVPLHSRRLRWRGFNQSELLANQISQNLTPGLIIPLFDNLLFRQKFTLPQMRIKNYQERKNNLKDAFILNRDLPFQKILKNKTVLLIDDVSTTGSTLNECAKVLKINGAKLVFGAVIARQEIK